MGFIDEIKIAAAEADTYVGDAHDNAETAYGKFNEGISHFRAALGALMMGVIDELGKAHVCFAEAGHLVHESDTLAAKARAIVTSIGLADSKNPLAKAQAEKINAILFGTAQALGAMDSIAENVSSLHSSAKDLGKNIGNGTLDVEKKDALPDLIETMSSYRNDAQEYLGEQ